MTTLHDQWPTLLAELREFVPDAELAAIVENVAMFTSNTYYHTKWTAEQHPSGAWQWSAVLSSGYLDHPGSALCRLLGKCDGMAKMPTPVAARMDAARKGVCP
jgi:hypothetical protein